MTELTIIPRTQSQQSPCRTILVFISRPDTHARFFDYSHDKRQTAIQTSGLQPQMDIVHIHDAEYSPLPSLQLLSELGSST